MLQTSSHPQSYPSLLASAAWPESTRELMTCAQSSIPLGVIFVCFLKGFANCSVFTSHCYIPPNQRSSRWGSRDSWSVLLRDLFSPTGLTCFFFPSESDFNQNQTTNSYTSAFHHEILYEFDQNHFIRKAKHNNTPILEPMLSCKYHAPWSNVSWSADYSGKYLEHMKICYLSFFLRDKWVVVVMLCFVLFFDRLFSLSLFYLKQI